MNDKLGIYHNPQALDLTGKPVYTNTTYIHIVYPGEHATVEEINEFRNELRRALWRHKSNAIQGKEDKDYDFSDEVLAIIIDGLPKVDVNNLVTTKTRYERFTTIFSLVYRSLISRTLIGKELIVLPSWHSDVLNPGLHCDKHLTSLDLAVHGDCDPRPRQLKFYNQFFQNYNLTVEEGKRSMDVDNPPLIVDIGGNHAGRVVIFDPSMLHMGIDGRVGNTPETLMLRFLADILVRPTLT